jgi:formate/nitrite transporter FocA (FNT family)
MMATLLHLSGSYLSTATVIAAAKCAAPIHVTFIKSLLCNLCVCLAVSIGCTQKSPLEKFICAALPVTCFVACGWEHSIADMFFLPLGAASLPDMLRVIGIATIGNMLSGFAIAKARQHV